MSLAVLTQVYDEMRRVAIAGSVTAGGDFRLKKLIPPLEQAGAKAPVFGRVAEAVKALVEGTEQTSAPALLELCSLVNAVLYTQGETGLAGEWTPLETIDLGPQTSQASARLLKPLLEALTSTGGGRLEIIKDAYERDAFLDLRLVRPALLALDDSYPEIADFVAEKVLPRYGKAILSDLKEGFDLKGKANHARRLALMYRLDPMGSRELVKQVLERGSKELKIVAVGCLGDSPEDLSFLLEQAAVKNKDIREAALKSLAKLNSDEAVEALKRALAGNDIELAVRAVRENFDPRLLAYVVAEIEQQLEPLLKAKKTAKGKAELSPVMSRLLTLLGALEGRKEDAVSRLLMKLFERRDEIRAVKADPGGENFIDNVVFLMRRGSVGLRTALLESHASLPPRLLGVAFEAALETVGPGEVAYEAFSPYLRAQVDPKKRSRDPAWEKREAISNGIIARRWRKDLDDIPSELDDDEESRIHPEQWDPRWLELAIELQELGLVQALARRNHAGSLAFLVDAFAKLLKGSDNQYEIADLLDTMIRLEHPEATACLIASLEKLGKTREVWKVYWVGRLIPNLPKAAIGTLEAVLPTLHEKVVDALMEYVAVLKDKA